MNKAIRHLKRLLNEGLPQCEIDTDPPNHPNGNWWLDVSTGREHRTLEYRPETGFGIFRKDAGYGEGPAEIYRTPERAVKRLVQLMTTGKGKSADLNLKDLRELYGLSQVALAEKVGIKQSAISRFEKRDEVKLSTLAAAVKAIGGILELRAHFPDADVPLSLSKTKHREKSARHKY